MAAETYDTLINDATKLELNEYKPEEAAGKYQKALELAETREQRFHCMRKLGVCYQLLHQWNDCIAWHDRAYELADTDVERANTRVDRSQGYRGNEDYTPACEDLERALAVFNPVQYMDRFAVVCQFHGHVLLDMNRTAEAVFYLELAVKVLSNTETQHDELYALLRLSIAYARNGQPLKSRGAAFKALRLARHVGSKAHKLRAILLLSVGNWLRVMTERRLQRFVR